MPFYILDNWYYMLYMSFYIISDQYQPLNTKYQIFRKSALQSPDRLYKAPTDYTKTQDINQILTKL